MYKPPENHNRVKSIKSKFENIENNSNSNNCIDINRRNGGGSHVNPRKININKTDLIVDKTPLNLTRQLSDPAKRNIKRTPAFRLDKSSQNSNNFERTASHNRSHYFETKVKQFNSALKNNNCDTNNSDLSNRTEAKNNKTNVPKSDFIKPILMKSKSSHDFAYIRSKFDQIRLDEDKKNSENQRNHLIATKKLTQLYTEPIPKALRPTKPPELHIYDNVAGNTEQNPSDVKEDIYTAATLKVGDSKKETTDLTDTLKSALKRPLPPGPAPKKPPRTFEHTPVKDLNLEKNQSFLHLAKPSGKANNAKAAKASVKKDPRYMLNKLENALRNNKIRTKSRPVKNDTLTTSGEDSDDSLLFRSKSNRNLPSIPDRPSSDPPDSFNLNCLNGLTFCQSNYEKIGEPNSSFFVSCKREEPIYAEPFNFGGENEVGKNVRNSLYYMSTSLLLNDDEEKTAKMDENRVKTSSDSPSKMAQATHKQISAENSSLSSFTSDLDSATSTPPPFESSPKIRQLIDAFETTRPSENSPVKSIEIDNTHRVEDLKMALQQTLDRYFDAKKETSDLQQNERKVSVDKMVSKFQTYVKTMPKYRKLSKDDRLFYCCLIVGWDLDKPKIQFKFPINAKIPDRIEDLCYPEAASGPLDKSNNAQCYSLVITNDKGERTFGYCRRVIPEGSNRCIPLAYCILSKHRAPRFYKKILIELESRHGIPDKLRTELISEFYFNKFPQHGGSIRINLTNMIEELNAFKNQSCDEKGHCIDNKSELVDSLDLTSFVHVNKTGEYGTLNKTKKATARSQENIFIGDDRICNSPSIIVETGGKTELILSLHHDSRYEEADLKPLHRLPAHILLKIFASLLLERKVILISCVISKLSCCVDALQSILYPFSWPHTFIPILPQCLWDVVESPTPVICGILSVAIVNEHKIEHGIVVDLDEGSIVCEEGDEDSILSDSMKRAWHQGFNLASRLPPEDYAHSVYLSDAYIKVFIASLKHYKNHIVNGNFEKEAFIRNGKTKGIRRFLKWFTETTMFLSFIDSVISNSDNFTLFDNKIEMYGSDESNAILSKLLEWKQ